MRLLPFFLILSLSFSLGSIAAAESTLVKLVKVDSKDIAQVFFTFDQAPRYSPKITNKRVDILFEDTRIAPDVQLFEADDRIVRIVPSTRENMSVVSFFFRYQPQKVELSESRDGKVVLEVLLGNRYSGSYQDLSERLKGLTVVEDEQVDYSNPLIVSPYAHDWRSFIRNYESPITIDVGIQFTFPPFPIINLIPPGREANESIFTDEQKVSAATEDYGLLAQQVLDELQVTYEISTQKLLALTYGEALLRNGDFTGGYKQLYLLWQEFPNEHVGLVAHYLLILAEAKHHDPYLAHYNLKEYEQSVPTNHPLAPYVLISRVETSIATKQYDEARVLLNRDDIAFPKRLNQIRQLRQGDYFSSTEQLVKGYVTYTLINDQNIVKNHPFSLNNFCDTLYRQKKYKQAADCYNDLAPQISDPESLSKIAYRAAMSELRFKSGPQLLAAFARVEDAFPQTLASELSAIKQTDLKLLTNPTWTKQAAYLYGQIGENSIQRSTVAEALFKEAIAYSLLGETGTSIELLMDLLRNLRSSDIRESVQALLLSLLPEEIEKRIDNGDHMQALVLAKQNRNFFENNWLPLELMAKIADAYQKVGIHNEAQRVYLYLLEMSDIEKREEFFLPLIQSVYDRGDYGLVEDYSSQYTYNYPEGNDSDSILILRLRALLATERFADARDLLPDQLPDDITIRLLASEIYFTLQDYAKCREILLALQDNNAIALDDRSLFLLAESSFQLGEYLEATMLYETMTDKELYSQQSLYRLAQIARSNGDETNALKLFEQIVEKKKSSVWKRYAEKELEYAQLKESIDSLIDG